MTRIAIVQHAPAVLDRDATLANATQLAAEAARDGARLVVFSEAVVPGYPAWIWRLRPGPDMSLAEQIHARLLAQAVDVNAGQLAPLQQAAREHAITIVCGLHERDAQSSRTTLYNSVVTIGPGGELLNRHRKLVPTSPERMVWGFGDATYRASRDGDRIHFDAETESPRFGRLRWQGTVSGRRLDGTLTMVRDGAPMGEKWVLAGER